MKPTGIAERRAAPVGPGGSAYPGLSVAAALVTAAFLVCHGIAAAEGGKAGAGRAYPIDHVRERRGVEVETLGGSAPGAAPMMTLPSPAQVAFAALDAKARAHPPPLRKPSRSPFAPFIPAAKADPVPTGLSPLLARRQAN